MIGVVGVNECVPYVGWFARRKKYFYSLKILESAEVGFFLFFFTKQAQSHLVTWHR